MQEPEIKTTVKDQPPVKKKRGWKKVLLYIIIVLVVLLGGGYGVLRLIYSDEYIKNLAETKIATAVDGECEIEGLDISIFGNIEITGLSLRPAASMTDKQFLKIKKISAKIDLLKSIISFRPNISVLIDNTEIDVERVLSAQENINVIAEQKPALKKDILQEKYSTNIHDTLRSLAELDWKSKLKDVYWKILNDIYWRIPFAVIKVNNTVVRVQDQEGKLEDCVFTVNFAADLNEKTADLRLAVAEQTPNISDGKIDLKIKLDFDWQRAKDRQDKPLAFIGALNFSTLIENFDLEYIGKYYIQNAEQIARLDSPLSGKILLQAADIAQVDFDMNLNLAKAVSFVKDNKVLAGGAPDFKLNVKGQADLSREWSEIKLLDINILSKNIQTGQELVSLSSKLNGSFGSEVYVVLNSRLGVGNILASSVGELFGLDKLVTGGINIGSEFVWKRAADWEYALTCTSDKLIVNNKGISAPAPVNVGVSGKIKTVSEFEPESVSALVKVTSPGVEVKTVEAVVIPLKTKKFFPRGQADLYVNLPQVFTVFEKPLAVLGLQKINEVFEARVSVDNKKTVSLTGVIKNTDNFYPPCIISGALVAEEQDKFVGKLELKAENKAVQLVLNAEGITGEEKTQVDFSNQFVLRSEAAMNLGRRFAAIIAGGEFPSFPVTGIIRGGVKGKLLDNSGKVSLRLASSLALNDITFTDRGRKFVEKNGSLSLSMNLNDVTGKKLLSVKDFVWKSDSLTASARVKQLGLTEMSADLLQGIGKIKDAQIRVAIVPVGFKNLSALAGGSAAEWIANAKLFKALVKTQDDGLLSVDAFELQSAGLNAKIQNLQVNPQQMFKDMQNKDYNALLAGVSPFNIIINSDNQFWQNISLPQGLEFRGKAEAAISYEPDDQRLNINKLILAGDKSNKAFVSRLSIATVIDKIGTLIENHQFPQVINSLSQGVNIPVVTLSIARLKDFLRANGNELPLSGKSVELQNFRLLKTKNKDALQIYGNVASNGLAVDNLLRFNGSILLNNLLSLNSDSLAVTGEIKLDKAGIIVKAKPYVYNKSAGTAAKIYYKLNAGNNGTIMIKQAGMSGGPVVFGLRDFAYIPKSKGKFALSLPVFKISSPVALSVSNVEVSPDNDLVRAQLASPGIDLTSLSSSLDLGFPSKLSGKIGGMNVVVNDKYSTLIDQDGKRISTQNKLAMAPSKIRLDSSDSTVSMQLDIGKVGGDTADGKFYIDGIKITSPTGFATKTPIDIGRIESMVDMDTLFKQPLIVNEVIVGSFKAVYEMKAQGNNLAVLQKNIARLLPASGTERSVTNSSASSPQSAKQTASAGVSSGKAVLIKDLYLNNGAVNLQTPILKGDFDIPPTHIKDIGGDNPRLAFTTILQVLVKSIGTSAVTFLKDNPAKAVESVTNLVGDVLKKANKNVSDEDGKENNNEQEVGKQINQGLKAIQGLFGQ